MENKRDWQKDKLPQGQNYFLVSKKVIEIMKLPEEKVSKPDKCGDLFIIIAGISSLEEEFTKARGPQDFWAREIVLSNVTDNKIKRITLQRMKRDGIKNTIEIKTGATTGKNVACVIGSICLHLGISPLELFNKVSE